MHRVVVTGMGVISPVGQSVEESFASLIAARSGVRVVPSTTYTGSSLLAVGAVDFHSASHPGVSATPLDRATQFALAAAAQAVALRHGREVAAFRRMSGRHRHGAR